MKTKEILNDNNFKFQKKYGQNFLVNPKIPERIALSVTDLPCGDKDLSILEIGAGAGALTAKLAGYYKKVCALEIDESLKDSLDTILKDCDNAEVVFRDVMKTELKSFCKEKFGNERVAVCANLPYYITTPIIMSLFESGAVFESITVMVQKEVAMRICSKPGDESYGAFTVAVNLYSEPKRLFDVGKGNFYPVPKIDSSIVKFNIHKDKYSDVDKNKVKNVIRAAFSQRRKTLYNCLSNGLPLPKEIISEAIEKSGLNPKQRAEELSCDDFITLSDNLFKK